jgi:hypothetical protein
MSSGFMTNAHDMQHDAGTSSDRASPECEERHNEDHIKDGISHRRLNLYLKNQGGVKRIMISAKE